MNSFLVPLFSILFLSLSISAQSVSPPCPAFELIEPAGVILPSDSITFSLKNTNKFDESNLNYVWSTSEGQITEGQNSATIKIMISPQSRNESIKVTVKIKGLPSGCTDEFVDEILITSMPEVSCGCYDAYSSLDLKSEYARLDMFMIRLLDNPTAEGYILLTVAKNETIGKGKRHIKKLLKHIEFRKFDKSRLTLAVNKSDFPSRYTRLIAVPENVPPPECDKCEFTKGENIR